MEKSGEEALKNYTNFNKHKKQIDFTRIRRATNGFLAATELAKLNAEPLKQ